MSRLTGSDLHLTFRNWSTSGSDDSANSESDLEPDLQDLGTQRNSINLSTVSGLNGPNSLYEGAPGLNAEARAPPNWGSSLVSHINPNTRDRYSLRSTEGGIIGGIRRRGSIHVNPDLSVRTLDDNEGDETTEDFMDNWVYGHSFFQSHAEHEALANHSRLIHQNGLSAMMNNVLRCRSAGEDKQDAQPKKRSYLQACLGGTSTASQYISKSSLKDKFQPSMYLQNGSFFSVCDLINGNKIQLKFADVNYQDLKASGVIQIGDVTLSFSGEIVDYQHNDLRLNCEKQFIDGNIFNNLLRNRLVFSKRFDRLFDETPRKHSSEKNYLPFSMNRLGYILSNSTSSKIQNLISCSTRITPSKPRKFPNGSIFSQVQSWHDSSVDVYKSLSRWFELPPLNQYSSTPSPPTPPHSYSHHRCVNTPENLLTCIDCLNSMNSNFVFLKLEIDIQDLFEQSHRELENLYILPDGIFKKRRKFKKLSKRYNSDRNRGSTKYSNSSMKNRTTSASYETLKINGEHTIAVKHSRLENNKISARPNIQYNENSQIYRKDLLEHKHLCGVNVDFLNDYDLFGDTDEDLTDTMDFTDNEDVSDNYMPSHNVPDDTLAAVWPLSTERLMEHHPLIDPEIASNDGDASDEYDNSYTLSFNGNRSRRLSRLLFSIGLNSDRPSYQDHPVPASQLYKNDASRLSLKLIATINRSTGDLNIIPANLDPNLWTTSEVDGELFDNVETFGKVFNLFMNSSKESIFDTESTRNLKNWLINERFEETNYVKTLLALQVLSNPGIVHAYKKRKNLFLKKLSSSNKYLALTIPNTQPNKFKKFKVNSDKVELPHKIMHDELTNLAGAISKFDVDNDRVLTFKSGKIPTGSNISSSFSFAYE